VNLPFAALFSSTMLKNEPSPDSRLSGREVMDSLPFPADNDPAKPRATSIRAGLAEISLSGDLAQFGVYRGRTARLISRRMKGQRKLHLFDSFEGLPEDWTDNKKAGHFKLAHEDIPVFDSANVVIHKGWFKETVPRWAAGMREPLAFVHIDADLYTSTVDVLFGSNRLIVPGTVILFDEYVLGRSDDEHRALFDWAAKYDRKFDYLWRTSGAQVCIRVTL
jgi:hypothetical protein